MSAVPLTLSRPPGRGAPGRDTFLTPEQRAQWPVALVSMPFMEHDRPSIQLGLLKAIGTAAGFPVTTLHANLDFAARIGTERYVVLCEQRGRMVGDWLFSVEAFGDAAPDRDARLLDDFADDLTHLGGTADEVRERLLATRLEEVPAYLDALEEALPWGSMKVVGFTSTFQQNAASFALARRLKARHPHLVTVFGGANFDGEMGLELVRTVDCIDYAVIGEGDSAFPALLDALAAGEDPAGIPGVARRRGGQVVSTPPAPPLTQLDDLPIPDYAEYFQRTEDLGLLPRTGHRNVWIPFESARGCWWGAKHHCTFCGLNGGTMTFRSKSPERVFDELAHHAKQYRSFKFGAVDNILDMGYLKKLLPAIVESGADYELFYEVKANLSRAQLKLLAQSGVTRIQPGLESLNSHVLALMRKGIRAAQNVNLLRWAQYYGIGVAWNVLWGFPGETEEDYAEMARVVPHLVHLRPPGSASRIWMERFSPLFTEPDSFGRMRRTPEEGYRYVYPATVDGERIAYFFQYELEDALPDSVYDPLRTAIADWNQAWQGEEAPVLTYWSAPDFLQIYDNRTPQNPGTYTFTGELAEIYLACSDRPTTASAVRDKLGLRRSVEELREVFGEFGARGLMFLDGDLAVALALPAVPGR
ncbi:RiPP maturation radical SAM C-methyltransferase [Blastococcus sp. TF02A-35]|uniref:RiPP maturation radical SAM C-methyltransferase n=1 Tax=Blastococcus sp. TF02A-35 TaxID=2559612 RepID=UPI0010731938|nr:RiPP maturation radical SAM C-methyltransferase [Blastococcus sp. TF02A_35]TFV48902.1 RiPP maturation radical SAM protein 1 [Blastococcus sp. TF02A_35]